VTQLGAVAWDESPGHPEKSTTTGMPSFSASRMVLRLTSPVLLRMGLIGMQRVAVTTQGADGRAVIGQNSLKLGKSRGIFEHRELAVRIAGIVPRAEFDGFDMERRLFLENRDQPKLRRQGRKDSNTHNENCRMRSACKTTNDCHAFSR